MMMIGDKTAAKRPQYTPSIIVYIMFLFKPFALSANALVMRKSKRLDESAVDCYKAFSLFLVLAVVAPVTGQDIGLLIRHFNFLDLGLLLIISLGSVLLHKLRQKALKLYSISGLQPYNFAQLL